MEIKVGQVWKDGFGVYYRIISIGDHKDRYPVIAEELSSRNLTTFTLDGQFMETQESGLDDLKTLIDPEEEPEYYI